MARNRKGLFGDDIDSVKEEFNKACDETSNIIKTYNPDGLPDFRETFEIQTTKWRRTYWFSNELDPKVVLSRNALKLGRWLTPYYYPLYQYSPSLAQDLARCVLRWVDEKPRGKTITVSLGSLLNLFKDILVINGVTDASNITTDHLKELFIEVSNKYVKSSHVTKHRTFVNVIKNLPQLDEAVHFFLTEQSSIPKPEAKKITAADIEEKLNRSHSDKTMFQIAGYTHYSLDLISSTIQTTESYIASAEYIDAFEINKEYKWDTENNIRYIGREKFFKAIDDGELEKAKQMELATTYKFILAYEFVRDKTSPEVYAQFCKQPDTTVLPKDVSKNSNVIYVVTVLSQIRRKQEKTKFISALKNGNYSTKTALVGGYYYLSEPKKLLYNSYSFCTAQFGWNQFTENMSHHKTLSPITMLLGRTQHYDLLVVTYLLMNTGCNLEVFTSMPNLVGSRPIIENYNKKSGAGEDAPLQEREVMFFGYKNRVGAYTPAKKIYFSVPVQSLAYKYLAALNAIRPVNRELFFQFKRVKSWNNQSRLFIKKFSITDSKGGLLPSLQSKKFRKTFLGHKVLQRLQGINSADELIVALRTDMDHADFSTTMAYLMQTGHSSLVIDATIVALQTKLIDDGLDFAGEIKFGKRKPKEQRDERFLCDCADPSNPPHDINLAHCRKYHLCLGCSRANVFREHLPAIIYHILEIEDEMVAEPEVYKIAYEVRYHQAKDVIARFKLYSENGEEAVENAYQVATAAKVNNTPLCLPMLNV